MYIFQAWLTFKEPEAKCLANQYFMSNDIQAPQEASEETQQILKELQEEGHEIAGQKPEEPKDEPKADPQPEKKEEEKPADKPEDKSDDQKPVDQVDDKKKQPPVDRTTKAVPVGKYNDERHKRQEAEKRAEEAERRAKELEELSNSTSNQPSKQEMDTIREAAKKVAEKHGYDNAEFIAEFAETIVAEASKRNVLPKEIEAKLKAFDDQRAEQQARDLEVAQETGFNTEFSEVIKEFPDLVDHKDDLKQLAFMEGNEKTALRRLALEYMHDNPVQGRKTVEAPLPGRTDTTDVIDYNNITEEQFKNLTPKQMDEYMDHLDKKSKY